MLATLGFVISAVLLAAFAFTFTTNMDRPAKLGLSQFSSAYLLLATAFGVWGIGSAMGDNTTLKVAVFLGDWLLLLGSLMLLNMLAPARKRTLVTVVGSLAVLAFLMGRIWVFPPHPVLSDGVLLFNTQRLVALGIGVVLACVWLPANFYAAKRVAKSLHSTDLSSLFTTIYTTAVLVSLLFLASHKRNAVILSFIAMSITFLLMAVSNVLAGKLRRVSHGK